MSKLRKLTLPTILPYLLLGLSIIGLMASFALTYDKIHTLINPDYEAACSINPILSCGSVMKTEQASLFGIPNSVFGLLGYVSLATLAVTLLAGATFRKWLWLVMQAGASIGVIFMHYLFFQGVFRINAICPYCFVVWMVTIPIFWYITVYNLKTKNISFSGNFGQKATAFIQTNHGNILTFWYILIFGILLQHFWYYWQTLI